MESAIRKAFVSGVLSGGRSYSEAGDDELECSSSVKLGGELNAVIDYVYFYCPHFGYSLKRKLASYQSMGEVMHDRALPAWLRIYAWGASSEEDAEYTREMGRVAEEFCHDCRQRTLQIFRTQSRKEEAVEFLKVHLLAVLLVLRKGNSFRNAEFLEDVRKYIMVHTNIGENQGNTTANCNLEFDYDYFLHENRRWRLIATCAHELGHHLLLFVILSGLDFEGFELMCIGELFAGVTSLACCEYLGWGDEIIQNRRRLGYRQALQDVLDKAVFASRLEHDAAYAQLEAMCLEAAHRNMTLSWREIYVSLVKVISDLTRLNEFGVFSRVSQSLWQEVFIEDYQGERGGVGRQGESARRRQRRGRRERVLVYLPGHLVELLKRGASSEDIDGECNSSIKIGEDNSEDALAVCWDDAVGDWVQLSFTPEQHCVIDAALNQLRTTHYLEQGNSLYRNLDGNGRLSGFSALAPDGATEVQLPVGIAVIPDREFYREVDRCARQQRVEFPRHWIFVACPGIDRDTSGRPVWGSIAFTESVARILGEMQNTEPDLIDDAMAYGLEKVRIGVATPVGMPVLEEHLPAVRRFLIRVTLYYRLLGDLSQLAYAASHTLTLRDYQERNDGEFTQDSCRKS